MVSVVLVEGKVVMIDCKEIRKALHEHPQTAGNEQFAHDMIVRHLQGLHPTKVYTHVGGYGVVAVWQKGEGCRTIAFRADTDALPIGHRCGHDGHTTILLRLAELVDEMVATLDIQYSILLLWQPSEETGEGSRAVIESGILQQYDIGAFYALHNLPGYPLGRVVVCPHTFAAASVGVVYTLQGRETHASTPELGINPGMAVSEMIARFNGLNGRDGVFRQSTLICVRVGEPAFGTSAGSAEVMFTLRAYSNDEMGRLLADANGIVDECAAKHGLTAGRTLVEPFRATENHEECVDFLMRECGNDVIVKEDPFRWSEDFAEYLMCWPGAMFGIGSGEGHKELHHPDYDFPDEVVEPAARVFLSLAKKYVSD